MKEEKNNHQNATTDRLLFIETYGCQMNVADSEVVASIMEMAGYAVTENIEEADAILRNAQAAADRRGDAIVSEAKQKADGIVRRAEEDAALERRKAAEEIKKEIVDVSSALAEKMLEREIRSEDHRALIDSFINEVGEDHGGNN